LACANPRPHTLTLVFQKCESYAIPTNKDGLRCLPLVNPAIDVNVIRCIIPARAAVEGFSIVCFYLGRGFSWRQITHSIDDMAAFPPGTSSTTIPMSLDPNGIAPNFFDGPSLQPVVLATGVIFIIVSVVFVAFRFVKAQGANKFGKIHIDDCTQFNAANKKERTG